MANRTTSDLPPQSAEERDRMYDEEEHRAMSGDDDLAYRVELYVYDLSRGLARTMSPALLGKQIEAIWHTGVVAYGREYYFGSGGIESCRPGGTILGEPDRIEELGSSQVPYQLFLEYIFGLGESTYKPAAYDLLKHNCNNFSDEVSQFLCGRGIPKNIISLPDEFLNTPLGETLIPYLENLQLKATDSHSVNFGNFNNNLNSYTPKEIHSSREDPELEELNCAIEELRQSSKILENRRHSLNEKLLKREKKEKKKERKKKKKSKSNTESGDEPHKKRHHHRDPSFEESRSPERDRRRLSEPSLPECSHRLPPTPLPGTGRFEAARSPERKPSNSSRSPEREPSNSSRSPEREPSNSSRSPRKLPEWEPPTYAAEPQPSVSNAETEAMENQEEHQSEEVVSDEHPAPPMNPEPEPEVPREPPILFREEVDSHQEFDEFVRSCADLLSAEEQQHMEELRAYVVEDEGSWALGENFNVLFARVFHDPSIPADAKYHLIRIMASAALKDDVILMLHQDRREHTIMNFANKIESHSPEIQEALALFFCNMFEHLSPSEWLLYISEWPEEGQQISNIRVTTKVAVNALLHSKPQVQEYGTALMYNLGTKEVKTVVFDDVAPELAMAILQYFSSNPSEELLWRTMTALCRFCYASSEVPQLIKMVGPQPTSFRGKSERIDVVIDEVETKLSKVRMF